ncbi:MAG: hypothetical protein H0U79_01020 [Solirubrobacterales bacterium]|nr:hypothetical protein [Solirubrobacterales bacterium]
MAPSPEERDFETVHRAGARRDLPGLLAMLEGLDATEEAEVVRSALEAGVPYDVALAEVQREIERRLVRLLGDEAGGSS